ncbi:MAG TPA: 2-hydroxyacyl-CoA dehydratase family protein [Candidatus Dormibacteraeota bacterium]|nr:2-hydroxyacyl-CoA dehydratase family protein [Candidatus Dormibacteraeota bacterium]
MTAVLDVGELIGRGRRDGNHLFKDWFTELDAAAGTDEPVAYTFVMGSMAEVLRAFDFHIVFPEINSLQAAVKKQSLEYLNRAEDYGYSTDVCGYVKADVGSQLQGGRHPNGRIPKPKLVIATNMCNTYVKWVEIWQRLHGCEVFVFDLPGQRGMDWKPEPGDRAFESDRRYVQGQLEELIALCERITGRPFDIDRLREVLGHVNSMAAAWSEVLRLNRSRPAPFNVLGDGLTYMGMLSAYRGTAAGASYMRDLHEEMAYKAAHHLGTIENERFRLHGVGPACYPYFRRFLELFQDWGAVFVSSEYLAYAGGGLDQGIHFDLERPLESLAEQLVLTAQRSMSSMFFSQDRLYDAVREWGADGIVYHSVKSCRTVSTGMADSREYLTRVHQVPALFLESDLVDPRAWSEAQLKNRVDAYFEALASRKAAAAAGR